MLVECAAVVTLQVGNAVPIEPCTIFYSWQSQLPNATNRGFIERALEISARAVREDATIDVRPEVDQDTANVPGSPNIADVIRQKIDAAEIVICDASRSFRDSTVTENACDPRRTRTSSSSSGTR
jgi:hypothetical protein